MRRHLIANTTKKEFINPVVLTGAADLESICTKHISGILPFLLRRSSESGGGDLLEDFDYQYAGRWAGDCVSVIGEDDLDLYQEILGSWKDISLDLTDEWHSFMRDEECRFPNATR